ALAAISLGVAENQEYYAMVSALDTVDPRVAGYLARTFGSGPVRVRAGIGAGFALTYASTMNYNLAGYTGDPSYSTYALGPFAEGSFLVDIDAGGAWGIHLGATATKYAELAMPGDINIYGTEETFQRPLTLQLLAGIRHSL